MRRQQMIDGQYLDIKGSEVHVFGRNVNMGEWAPFSVPPLLLQGQNKTLS